MIHVRGHRADFDAWAQTGATGWDYDSVRPYFERALAIQEEVLGARHPDTATSLNNVGYLLRACPARWLADQSRRWLVRGRFCQSGAG